MVNLFFKRIFGQIPSTEKYVRQSEALRNEMNHFDAFSESDKMRRYHELEAVVRSQEHIEAKQRLKTLKYQGSSEQILEKEFIALTKNKDLRIYFKVLTSSDFERFQAMEQSGEITDEKFHTQYLNSKKYKTYQNIVDSSVLKRYNELDAYLKSDGFKKQKEYLMSSKKFENSEHYRNEQELKALKSDPEVVTHLKLQKSNKFDAIRAWNPVFEETFDRFDESKWLAIPFQAVMNLQGRSYVPEGNIQFHTEGKNLTFSDSCINIETRRENVSGLRWQATTGFRKCDFEYTSGMINTGHSFRVKEGKIEILARMTSSKEIVHSLFLRSEKMAPHIDVFCTGTKKGIKTRLFLTSNNKPDFEETVTGINPESNYLYSLEWGSNYLRWQINGFTVAEYTGKLPQNPLYLGLSSVMLEKTEQLPANLIVDTVRVYERVQ